MGKLVDSIAWRGGLLSRAGILASRWLICWQDCQKRQAVACWAARTRGIDGQRDQTSVEGFGLQTRMEASSAMGMFNGVAAAIG